MAIERLKYAYNDGEISSSGASTTDIINKINELVDFCNRQHKLSIDIEATARDVQEWYRDILNKHFNS